MTETTMTETTMTETTTTETPVGQTSATAWSSGRTFHFEAPLSFPLAIGGLVVLSTGSREYLGQVVDTELGPAPGGAGHVLTGLGTLVGALGVGAGAAAAPPEPFDGAALRTAPADVVHAWLTEATAGRTTLELGRHRDLPDEPVRLLAAGFNRHTFLCGQSGSGKTYTLGLVLEQLLLETTLRIVVLDPNSDYSGLAQLADRPAAGGRGSTGPVAVFGSVEPPLLQVRYGRLPLRQQAMVLALDPVADMDEYDELRRLTSGLESTEYSLADVRQRLEVPEGSLPSPARRRLALRIDNLGVADWGIWAPTGQPPLLDQLPPGWRAAVLDLGQIASSDERSAVVASVLTGLWHRRHAREPVLLVVDEAHNVCPAEPDSPHQALAVEHAIRIAAEGRKYGLYLLVATQSPHKLHPNVLAQCENLVLMKTNSVLDVERLGDAFSHVPRGLIAQAPTFRLGEGLVAGRISPVPQMFRSGIRQSPEGGADVPVTWAD
jgi:hypothetical protein